MPKPPFASKPGGTAAVTLGNKTIQQPSTNQNLF